MLFSCLFQCFEENEYQTESKQNETFRRVIFGTEAIQETRSRRQGSNEEATRQEGAPYPLGAPPYLVGTSGALRTLFSCTIRILVGKNSLYNLPKVLTCVSRKYPLFLFRAIFCQGCQGQASCRLPPPPTMRATMLG